jgi:sec-independent protein translocase protein TatA
MQFGNLGFMEILLILVVVLLLFGAKRLPEIGASFGKSIREFKRGLSDVNATLRDEPRDQLPSPPAPSREEGEVRQEPKRLLQ